MNHKDMHDIKRLDFGFDIKQVSDDGRFEGYASVAGNVDRGGDIVEPGAFRASLDKYASRGKMPKLLFQHDPSKVIGVWETLREDDKGLHGFGRLIKDTQLGAETHALMKAGAIDGLSIGYTIAEDGAEFEGPNSSIRRLRKLNLWEVSVVTFPMNEEATITHVKRLEGKGHVERILRDAGVPGSFAKLVAIHGFDGAKALVDGRREADTSEIEKALNRLSHNLKEKHNA